MAKIQELLDNLLHKKLGRDVRQSIHDSIEQCYKDATGHPDSVAAVIKENKNMQKQLDSNINTINGRIDTILTGTVNTTKLVTVHSATIRNNSASDLTFKISSKDNETLKSIKDKSPTVINANVIAKALDGVAINGKGIPSSYNVESTNDEYVITVYSGSSSVVGQYVFMAVVTIAYEDIATDISSAELKDVRAGADGTVYKSAGEAVRQQIGSLKESLKDINVETDKTLKVENKAADAKITGEKIETLDNAKISKPVEDRQPSNGTDGQILQTNGNGTVKWCDFTTTKELDTLSAETIYDMYKTDGLIKGDFVENIPIESENGKTYFTPFLDPNDYNNIFVDNEYGSPIIRFYDENKQFVSAAYRGRCYISKVIPSNAKYFVLQINTDNTYKSYYKLTQQSHEKIKKFVYSSKHEIEVSSIECLTVGFEKGEVTSGTSDKIYVIPNETYSLICNYNGGVLNEYDIHGISIKSVSPNANGITDYIASENAYYVTLSSYHSAYIALKGKIKKDVLTIPNLYLLPENINDSVTDKIKESLKLNQWLKKDAIAFGTSITYYSDKNNNVGYIELLSKELELNSYINCGADGQAVASGTRNGDGIVSKILSTDVSTYDLVTMEVGTNDFRLDVPLGNLGVIGDTEFDTTTFYGALRKSIEYIRENNKTCQILICTPLQRDNSGYDVNFANSKGLKLINYVNAIENISEMYSLHLVDLYRRSGITKSNLDIVTTDGLHPNNIGYKMIFSSMVGKIKNIYPIN